MSPTEPIELVWVRGEPVVLKGPAFFLRKGAVVEFNPGTILVPLSDCSQRISGSHPIGGSLFTWSFLLPDGSVTDFYLNKQSYRHVPKKVVELQIRKDLKKFFSRQHK